MAAKKGAISLSLIHLDTPLAMLDAKSKINIEKNKYVFLPELFLQLSVSPTEYRKHVQSSASSNQRGKEKFKGTKLFGFTCL